MSEADEDLEPLVRSFRNFQSLYDSEVLRGLLSTPAGQRSLAEWRDCIGWEGVASATFPVDVIYALRDHFETAKLATEAQLEFETAIAMKESGCTQARQLSEAGAISELESRFFDLHPADVNAASQFIALISETDGNATPSSDG